MKIKLIKLASLRKLNKTWTSLAAALVIGALAALAAHSVLGNRVDAIKSRYKTETVDVVVTRDAMRQGSPLLRQLLTIRKIPAEYAQSGAVRPEDFYRIDGRAVAYDLKGGDMIMWSQIESPHAPAFSERLAPGQRAVTVVVDEFNSVSGTLQPGDLIDLMVTTDREGQKAVFPLLQGVQVMATGQRSVDDPASGVTSRLATVTLKTSLDQARDLILARESGRFTALLRNPHDKLPAPGPNRAAQQPRPAAHVVPVLYGDAFRPGRDKSSAP